MSKRSNLSYDDGMMLWKTRDAYRVQTVLLAVFYLPQFLLASLPSPISRRGVGRQAAVYLLGDWGAVRGTLARVYGSAAARAVGMAVAPWDGRT